MRSGATTPGTAAAARRVSPEQRIWRLAHLAKPNFASPILAAFPDIPAGTASLDVSDNALTEVPAAIGGAADLEELLLFKNKIKTVDKAIGSLGKLTTLNLFNNVCMKVPPEIGQLGALEELNMAANKMMMLSDAHFAGLTSLKILTLNDNRLVKMGSLANLKAIEEIRLYGNNLEEMPVIGNSPELKIVEMNGNRIGAPARARGRNSQCHRPDHAAGVGIRVGEER